jgi:MFS family permease
MLGAVSMTQKSKIATVYLLGFALDLINMLVVNAAFPALQRNLHGSLAQLAWVGNLYMLGLTIVIPVGTWLAGHIGERRVLLLSLILFGGSDLGAAMAQTIDALMSWRLVQGLGGGLLIPIGQAMTYRAYPKAEHAALTSLVMAIALLVPALSPALGGLIVDKVSWRWIFFGMLPLVAIALALAYAWLPSKQGDARTRQPFDLPGFILSGLTLVAMLLGLMFAGEPAEGKTAIAALALGLSAGLLYLRHARRAKLPLLDLRLLSTPLLRIGIVIYLCVPGVFTGVNFVASLFLQNQLGLTAMQTGVLMMPWAAGAVVGIATTRRCLNRQGAKPLFASGLVIQSVGVAMLATAWGTSPAGRMIAFACMGLGGSLCSSAAQSVAFAQIRSEDMGAASALWNINRQLSFCLGIAMLGSALNLLFSLSGHAASPLLSYRACFLFAAALTLLPLPLLKRLDVQPDSAAHPTAH